MKHPRIFSIGQEIIVDGEVYTICLNPFSNRLVVDNDNGQMLLTDALANHNVTTIPAGPQHVCR